MIKKRGYDQVILQRWLTEPSAKSGWALWIAYDRENEVLFIAKQAFSTALIKPFVFQTLIRFGKWYIGNGLLWVVPFFFFFFSFFLSFLYVYLTIVSDGLPLVLRLWLIFLVQGIVTFQRQGEKRGGKSVVWPFSLGQCASCG